MKQATKENQYTKYYKHHSEKELRVIINSSEEYQDEARLAALEVLERQGIGLTEEEKQLVDTLKTAVEKNNIPPVKKEKAQEIKKELYSPSAIFGVTIFCGAFIGAILLNMNLRRMGKNNQGYAVVLLGLLLSCINSFLFFSKASQFILLGVNLASALIFMELFWKKYIGYTSAFTTRPIWKPLLIIIGVTVVLFALQMYVNPDFIKQLEELQKIN